MELTESQQEFCINHGMSDTEYWCARAQHAEAEVKRLKDEVHDARKEVDHLEDMLNQGFVREKEKSSTLNPDNSVAKKLKTLCQMIRMGLNHDVSIHWTQDYDGEGFIGVLPGQKSTKICSSLEELVAELSALFKKELEFLQAAEVFKANERSFELKVCQAKIEGMSKLMNLL